MVLKYTIYNISRDHDEYMNNDNNIYIDNTLRNSKTYVPNIT